MTMMQFCKVIVCNIVHLFLYLVAPPSLTLYVNATQYGSETDGVGQISPSSVRTTFYARGAKPAVNLRMKINQDYWIEQLGTNITQRGLVFDSYISHDYEFLQKNISVMCQAYGQTSIQPTNITKVLCKYSYKHVICNRLFLLNK